MIKIAIAEDHQAIIDGIKLLLEYEQELEIIGEVNNGEDLLELIKHKEPHVVISDIRMPKIDGITLTKKLQKLNPKIKVLAFTMYDQQEAIDKMISAGAKGYILKNAPLQTLIKAIKTVYNGNTFYDVATTNKSKENKCENSLLTQRQTEILRLIAQGKSTREIANELFIGVRTVETHRKNMAQKLNLKGRGELLRYALDCKYKFQ